MLVTNGDTRPALAITRSLGRLGHEVIVAADRQPSLASVSRHCAGREFSPPPHLDADSFLQAIRGIVDRRRIELLLPITEVTTWQFAEIRHRLPTSCVLPIPASDSLGIANDKACVLALAGRLGVPAPRSRTIGSAGELPDADGVHYPVVIKPARSRVRTATGWRSAAVAYAANADALVRILGRLPSDLYPVLLQERILGAGIGVFACYQHGRPVAFFSHRRLREKPPSGGVSVLCESVALDPEAAEHSRRLLSELRWHGVAMVEFKRDERDGSLKLMEINGRFWGSLQLAIDSGVDFPALVARIAAGETVDPVLNYRTGVRSRWFLGDLDAVLSMAVHSRANLNLPAGHPGLLRTLCRVLHPWQPDQRNEVLRRDDPRPGLLELRQWLFGR